MHREPPTRPTTFDPPAPVMGGMRWTRLPGPDPFWEMIQRSPRAPRPQRSAPAKPTPPPAPEVEGGFALHIVTTPHPEGRRGERYEYRARAYDAQTDGFLWHLEKAAPGMTVDRHTGVVTWTPTDGGRFEVTLRACNLFGKTARQTWTLCIRKPAVHKTPIANARYAAALRHRARRPRRAYSAPRRAPRRAVPARRAASPPDDSLRAAAIPLRR